MNMEIKELKIPAIRVRQPIGDFYLAQMPVPDILKISYSDTRRMTDNLDDYLGIQRMISGSRAKDLSRYISTIDATFPSSVILAIDCESSYFDEIKRELHISFDSDSESKLARVLDGQHRLAGFNENNLKFKNYDGTEEVFELPVSLFINSDMTEQAKIFTMVNQNQTKVNKSLVYDLEDLSKSRSPWKTAHHIAVGMNSTEGSPFYRRIKRLGVKSSPLAIEPISQAAFVDNLVKLISSDPQEDRNILLAKEKGVSLFGGKKLELGGESTVSMRPLRALFIDGNDGEIGAIVLNFFSAIESRWSGAWSKHNKESFLNTAVGLDLCFRILKNFLNRSIVGYKSSLEALQSIDIDDDYFVTLDKSTTTVPRILRDILG
jgi:DGQHR domain-containing protein